MKKFELLKYQLVRRGLHIVENVTERGQVFLKEERDGLVIVESTPEDILNLKKYLSFFGYKYLLRIRSTKVQILVKV